MICFVCQTPIEGEPCYGVNGEPMHSDCGGKL